MKSAIIFLALATQVFGLPLWIQLETRPVINVENKTIEINSTQISSVDSNELCKEGMKPFIDEPVNVAWKDKSKNEFFLTMPLLIPGGHRIRVETEAIYDSTPYLYWDKIYFAETNLIMTLPTPKIIRERAPLWVVFKVSIDHCMAVDIYTRLWIH